MMTPAELGWILAVPAAAAGTAVLALALLERLARAGLVRPNYRGRPVVTGLGVALVAGPLAALAVAAAVTAWAATPGSRPGPDLPASASLPAASVGVPAPGGIPSSPGPAGPERRGEAAAGGSAPAAAPGEMAADPAGPLALLLASGPSLLGLVAATALVGLVDDLLDEPVRGWRGHLGAGKALTGGRLKLLILPLLAWTLLPPAPDLPGRALAAALVAASANGMNLLDRRPGRALKAFFAAWLALAASLPAAALVLLPVAVAALVLLPLDLGERAMLGDAGSNALGAALGWALAALAPAGTQAGMLVGLAALHLAGEFHSLSRLIDALPPLRWADRLGTQSLSSPTPQGSSWPKE
ncbi:hypothetical protein [Thermaerobacter subterraneus]|nr:hypothetical protein [Thermaerobacter subterraneus]